jgi:hypothetical protein
VADPDTAEWLGPQPDDLEEERAPAAPLPAGFLAATYRAGDDRRIFLRLEPDGLPTSWAVWASGRDAVELLATEAWVARGGPVQVDVPWAPVRPPEKLAVRWDGQEAFLPLNVEDGRALPPPARLEGMSADDMLGILAAADPSAALRAWSRRPVPEGGFDDELDSATPVDLDPLRRYDLQATFLHRVRRRARVLAQLRNHLRKPTWSRQALQWRLRGVVGIEPLADRYVREYLERTQDSDEALLSLADFLIVLKEVDYQPADGAIPREVFEAEYQPFLGQLAARLGDRVGTRPGRSSAELARFWERVLDRCRP